MLHSLFDCTLKNLLQLIAQTTHNGHNPQKEEGYRGADLNRPVRFLLRGCKMVLCNKWQDAQDTEQTSQVKNLEREEYRMMLAPICWERLRTAEMLSALGSNNAGNRHNLIETLPSSSFRVASYHADVRRRTRTIIIVVGKPYLVVLFCSVIYVIVKNGCRRLCSLSFSTLPIHLHLFFYRHVPK